MAKNGILIVEFANQLRDRGMGLRQAVEEAATIRLRPVVMTMICTVLGGVPLVLASGAGAEARIALGWVIVGGLRPRRRIDPVPHARSPTCCSAASSPRRCEEEARLKRELEEAAYANMEPAE